MTSSTVVCALSKLFSTSFFSFCMFASSLGVSDTPTMTLAHRKKSEDLAMIG
jgi:hypothetical protein